MTSLGVTSARGRKLELLRTLRDSIPSSVRWCIRGGEHGLDEWLTSTGVKDVDIWVHGDDFDALCVVLKLHIKTVVSLESDPHWLRHIVFQVSDELGAQLVDVSYGDLKVGSVRTCSEELVRTNQGEYGPQLSGVSAVSDLLMRKLLRGKRPSSARLQEARAAWSSDSERERRRWLADLQESLGASLVRRVESILNARSQPTAWDRLRFATGALFSSLLGCNWATAFRRRRRLVLGARKRRILKRTVAPVLILCDRADVATRLSSDLRGLGITPLTLESRHASLLTLVRAALWGRAVVIFPDTPLTQNKVVKYLFGAPLLIDSTTRGGISEYLLKAHRWYIDAPAHARDLSSAIVGKSVSYDRL